MNFTNKNQYSNDLKSQIFKRQISKDKNFDSSPTLGAKFLLQTFFLNQIKRKQKGRKKFAGDAAMSL